MQADGRYSFGKFSYFWDFYRRDVIRRTLVIPRQLAPRCSVLRYKRTRQILRIGFYYNGASVTNVTQTASVWLAQGTGPANNRYLRVAMGNAATLLLSPTVFGPTSICRLARSVRSPMLALV